MGRLVGAARLGGGDPTDRVLHLSGAERSPFGFDLDLRATAAGTLRLAPSPDHLLGIHVGHPVGATFHCDGRSQRRLSIHGDIDLVPAGWSATWEDEAAATLLKLCLPGALLRAAAEGLGLDPDRAELIPQRQLRDQQLEHIGWALKAELEAGFPCGRLYVEGLGLALATRLLHRCASLPTAAREGRHGLTGHQLRRVVEYIEAHLDGDLSLARLADVAGVGQAQFKARFRLATGVPPHQFVIRRRVERAQTLILEGQLGLSQVALEAGFAHQSHLARWMRRLLGATPSEVARSRR